MLSHFPVIKLLSPGIFCFITVLWKPVKPMGVFEANYSAGKLLTPLRSNVWFFPFSRTKCDVGTFYIRTYSTIIYSLLVLLFVRVKIKINYVVICLLYIAYLIFLYSNNLCMIIQSYNSVVLRNSVYSVHICIFSRNF